MKKKVLILPSWYPSEGSPFSGIFIQDQTEVLSRKYEVTVLFPRLRGLRELIRGRTFPKFQTQNHHGYSIYREEMLVPDKLPYALRRPLYRRLVQRGFAKIVSRWGKPDIIHAHIVFPAGYLAARLGHAFDIPVVLTEHTGPFSVHLRSRQQRRLVYETLARVDKVLAVSPALARQMHMFQPNLNISVVGNVVMTDFFQPKKDDQGHAEGLGTRFVSVALMNRGKGIDVLLRGARLLLERGITSFHLSIGGAGPDLQKLKRLCRQLALDEHCHFLGMLTRQGVRQRIQNSDVFVLPSLAETFGVVVGEAMACGKPVLATRCGGPESILTDETGVLVPVGDPLALADAMEKFINRKVSFNPSVIRSSVLARFGEESFLRNLSGIYDQVWKRCSA